MEFFILQNVGPDKLWTKTPHTTTDNYFITDQLCDWGGPQGLGFLGTVLQNRLPGARQIEHKYFHKEITKIDSKAKHARYCKPIIMVKEEEDYQKFHFSFQRTGSTNILSYNSLSNGDLYTQVKRRGRGKNRIS